ncbi:MAG: DNA polymerase I [Coriobacteriia bacterium]|nr:DNA polymerase I [Coriobacteriia bacterium]
MRKRGTESGMSEENKSGMPENTQAESTKTIAVIDGNSLLHRAFHAVPPTMTAPDGRHTNACFGFLSMLFKLVDDFALDGIVCAFDAGIPAFRFDAIEKYKAQRPPTADELKEQFPIIKELLVALGIPVVEEAGWEGDDILGTVAARAEERGGIRTLLVTGDKDALQLASEHTHIITTKKGISDVMVYDPAAVVERFGVEPNRVPDFLGLMGDSSDNIPGVPGVGPKKATALLQEYGTMDAVLDRADEIKGKLGESLQENKEQALASREVATIVRDVELDLDFDAVRFPDFDADEVRRVFGTYALNTHVRKALKLIGDEAAGSGSGSGSGGASLMAQGSASQVETGGYFGCTPLTGNKAHEALEACLNTAKGAAREAAAGEAAKGESTAREAAAGEPTTGEQELPCAVLYLEQENATTLFDENARRLYIAIENSILKFEDTDIPDVLVKLFTSVNAAAFSLKPLLQELIPRDSSKPTLLDIQQIKPEQLFDLSVVSYLLDSSTSYKSLEEMSQARLPELAFGIPEVQKTSAETSAESTSQQGAAQERGAYLVALAAALHEQLAATLYKDDSLACYQTIERPLIPVLAAMERIGVNVDPEVLTGLSKQFAATIECLRTEAHKLAGEEFNLDSPKQLGVILFEKLKLPPIKKTRTGYSTDASVLQELKSLNTLAALMIEYRELAKLKSTYLDALPLLIVNDRHIHTSFNQTVTATGRLSSSDPNLQNIPVRTDLGRQIRTAFIPDASVFKEQEAVFLSADYSQIELRLLAHLSGDEHLIEAFLSGEDFHTTTASRVFSVGADEVTPKMRSRAKAVNFGIVYGQQAYGLASSLDIPQAEAQEMINRYFAVYPQVQSYLKDTIEQAREQGWVSTLFGRKRHVPELRLSNYMQRSFGERIAMNHPMQGSAADIIKLAMIEVARRLAEENFASQMILQVHDELDFNCARSELEPLSRMVKEAMEGVAELKVPLTVEVSYGSTWAEAH